MKKAIALTAMLLLGAALGFAALPSLFRFLPNDLERYRTVLQALASQHPDIVVFGDSRGAAGIDARRLPKAINASAHGVTLAEVRMFMQEVPGSAKTIVIVLGRDRFSFDFFPEISCNAIVMYGFRPDGETRHDLAEAFGVVDRTPLAQVAASRWTIRQSLDVFLHDVLGGRASRLHERDDLFLPLDSGQRLSPDQLSRAIASLNYASYGADRPDATGRKLLAQIARIAARNRQRVLVVVAPMHPRLFESHRLVPFESIPNVDVLDATTGFDDADFADPLHLTPAGAEKLTALVARRVEAMR